MFTRMGQELGEDTADGEPHVWNEVQHEILEDMIMRRTDEDNSSNDGDGSSSSQCLHC